MSEEETEVTLKERSHRARENGKVGRDEGTSDKRQQNGQDVIYSVKFGEKADTIGKR